jgi:hypothetical protein
MNNIDRLFKDCVNLKVVRLIGSPGKITSTTDAFLNCGKNGILYYDSKYGYSKIIRVLPDGWESVRYNTKDYGFD